MTEKQEQVLLDVGLRFPELVSANKVSVNRDWVWIHGRIQTGDENNLLAMGFKWSPRNQAYYHMCGVKPKGHSKGRPRGFKAPDKAREEDKKNAEKARNIAQAVVARVKAGKGGES